MAPTPISMPVIAGTALLVVCGLVAAFRQEAWEYPVVRVLNASAGRSALLDRAVHALTTRDLMEGVSRFRAHGIIVDVTAIDVMDSFAARSLQMIAHMTRLRGADTVIVGLQPEVAFAMVQLGLAFKDMHTALDLEEGLALLNRELALRKSTIGRDGVG